MPDRPNPLRPFKQWSRSHEQLLSLPKLHNLFPWKTSTSPISPQSNNGKPSFCHSTQTLSETIISSRLDPLERLDEVVSGPPVARLSKRFRSRLQTGLRSLLRSPSIQMRFSSMDALPTSPRRPSGSLRPSSIGNRPRTELFEPQLAPPSGSWIEVNEDDWSLKEPQTIGDNMLSTGVKVIELKRSTSSKSCATLTGSAERTKVKFEIDALKIPISSSDVQSNPPTDLSIRVKRLLGQGANGFCHEVSLNPILTVDGRGSGATRKHYPPRQCTLKVIPSNIYRRKRDAIHREISVQKRIAHPNVLKLFMAYHDSRLQAVCLLLEFCALGSLVDVVSGGGGGGIDETAVTRSVGQFLPSSCSTPLDSKQPAAFVTNRSEHRNPETGGLTDALTRHIFYGLMRALDHLHERLLIVHRDIKPSNIMLTDGWHAKLSDFGLACTVDQCLYDRSICGTPNYLAPEVFLREGHSKAADCWAAGATLYYALCARAPFQPMEQTNDAGSGFLTLDPANRISGTPTSPVSVSPQPVRSQVRSICRCLLLGRYEFPPSVSQPARLVIQRLLQRDPKSRPTAAEVMRMEFCLRQEELFKPILQSDQNKSSHFNRLRPLLHTRVIVDRLRRVRSLTGLQQRSRDTDSVVNATAAAAVSSSSTPGCQLFNTDGVKGLTLPAKLLHLRRSASDRIRHHTRPNLLLGLWDRSDPNKDRDQMNVMKSQFLPSKYPLMNSLSVSVGNTAFTGNEAIRDIFKLLGGRANHPKSDHLDIFHWISRWALTSDSLLYYTLGHVLVDSADSAVDSRLHVGPEKEDSWGVTNIAGCGIACRDGRLIRFEPKHNVPPQTCPDLPGHVDVQNHCDFLTRHLKRFNPLQNQPPIDKQADAIPKISLIPDPVFVERWQEHGNNVIFLLSTGGWQVNFHNHSKLIVHYPNILLSCDARRQSKDPCYASSIEFSNGDLETEFSRWLDRHPHLDHILQILLFMLL